MARGRSGTGKGLRGLRATGGETVQFMLFGVAGSVCLAIGLVILSVAFLRLLQTETGTTFSGNWSWAPYLICAAVVVAVAAVAVKAVSRGQGRVAAPTDKETR